MAPEADAFLKRLSQKLSTKLDPINLIPTQLVIFVENLELNCWKLSSWRFEDIENQRQ